MCHHLLSSKLNKNDRPEKARITQNKRAPLRGASILSCSVPSVRKADVHSPPAPTASHVRAIIGTRTSLILFIPEKPVISQENSPDRPRPNTLPIVPSDPSRKRKPKNLPRNGRFRPYFGMAAFTLSRFSRVSASSGSMLSAASNCATASGNRPCAA